MKVQCAQRTRSQNWSDIAVFVKYDMSKKAILADYNLTKHSLQYEEKYTFR